MESDVHSLRWCNTVHEKRKPRTVTGKVFYFMICDLMNWETRNRYKVMGKPIMANGEKLILFDLNSVETYEHNGQEGEKGKISRKPVLPNEWKGSFGIPYKEQKNALQISIFDQNYVVYSVVDNPTDVPADHMTDVTE